MKNLRLLLDWLPAVALVNALGEAAPGLPRVVAAMQLLRFVAGRTAIKQDDEVLLLLENILLTEQGRALVEYISVEIKRVMENVNAQ